ncbi:MAG: flagellar biosynthesis anti-sigma factor FlgM [Planctomycetota bacterium]|nr:flagellar biosynthesis anti-sigma factor FlgM [Planctomycetota bacterium]
MNGITTYQNLAAQFLSSNDTKRAAGGETEKEKIDRRTTETKTPPRADGVDLSEEARRGAQVYGMTKKLQEIPDPREEKVESIIRSLKEGSLVNDEAVRGSIKRMLNSGVVF